MEERKQRAGLFHSEDSASESSDFKGKPSVEKANLKLRLDKFRENKISLGKRDGCLKYSLIAS
jgi:hypothetical protein